MNIKINSLPTKTWNHLGMNGAEIEAEGVWEKKYPRVSGMPSQWKPDSGRENREISAELAPLLQGVSADVVQTAENEQMAEPVVLRYHYEPGEQSIGFLQLCARADSRMKVLLVLDSVPEAECRGMLEVQLLAEQNARIELYTVQLMSNQSRCVNHIGGLCRENAEVKLTRLELGSRQLWSGVNMNLDGRHSRFAAEIGYHGKPGQELDMNYVAVHRGEKTESSMEINGTLEDTAHKIFRGTIDFQRGCAGAKGTENENVLLMSENVVNQTLPVILCQEEDVEGNHGASIGQLDEKVLFYLGSRGIDREEAQKMISQARIEAICQKLPDAEVQQAVRAFEA